MTCKILFVSVLLLSPALLYGESLAPSGVDFTLRMGQGGFHDDRSPIGKLGGGQVALDVCPRAWPIGVSIFTECYTNSANPTHSYEIADLVALNLLFTRPLFGINRVRYFLGAGAGWVQVPIGEDDPDEYAYTDHYNLEAGVNVIAFWKIGLYGVVKYINAHKSNVIDFDETVVMLGVTLNL